MLRWCCLPVTLCSGSWVTLSFCTMVSLALFLLFSGIHVFWSFQVHFWGAWDFSELNPPGYGWFLSSPGNRVWGRGTCITSSSFGQGGHWRGPWGSETALEGTAIGVCAQELTTAVSVWRSSHWGLRRSLGKCVLELKTWSTEEKPIFPSAFLFHWWRVVLWSFACLRSSGVCIWLAGCMAASHLHVREAPGQEEGGVWCAEIREPH